MARTVDDIGEIRRTVYGRDMRKPLADALVHIKDYYEDHGIQIEGLTDASVTVLHDDYYLLSLTTSVVT